MDERQEILSFATEYAKDFPGRTVPYTSLTGRKKTQAPGMRQSVSFSLEMLRPLPLIAPRPGTSTKPTSAKKLSVSPKRSER